MTDITLTQVDADLARLNQYNLALEGFQRVMEGREVITGPTAMAMRIALEDAEVDQSDDKGVTGKDLVAGFKKVAITVRNIIQWLLRTIGKLVEKIGLGMQKLGLLNRKVTEKTKALPETAKATLGKEQPVEQPSFDPQVLSITGKFVGNDAEQLNNVLKFAEYLTVQYPAQFVKLMNAVIPLAKSHADDEDDRDFFYALGKVIDTEFKVPKIATSLGDYMEGVEVDGKYVTVPMMGDYGLAMFHPNTAYSTFQRAGRDGVDMLRDFFVIHFGQGKAGGGDVEVTTMSYEQIVKMSDICSKIIETNNDNATKYSGELAEVGKRVNQLIDEFSKSEGATRNKIGTAIGVLVQRMAQPLIEGQKWFSRTVGQELVYMDQCLEQVSQEAA